MSEAKHTPLPWGIDPSSDADTTAIHHREGDQHVCIIQSVGDEPSERELADADYICLACNNHAKLLAACEAALHDLETSEGLWSCDNEEGQSLFRLEHPSIIQLRAAIAAVKG